MREGATPHQKKNSTPPNFFFHLKSKIINWVIKFDSPLFKCPLRPLGGVAASNIIIHREALLSSGREGILENKLCLTTKFYKHDLSFVKFKNLYTEI